MQQPLLRLTFLSELRSFFRMRHYHSCPLSSTGSEGGVVGGCVVGACVVGACVVGACVDGVLVDGATTLLVVLCCCDDVPVAELPYPLPGAATLE